MNRILTLFTGKLTASLFRTLCSTWLVANLVSCESNSGQLFEEKTSSQTNIDFINKLIYNEKFNIFTYRNFYNGGGVGLGDINNDGFTDIYFTANMGTNRLYLNKGNWQFEDITEKAGVGGKQAWSTGVSMADINGDGWLDIYVCNSGDIAGDHKRNELFINNGDLTFTERAVEYGVDDRGYTTHAAFFDYDKDGDLDLYILNNSYQSVGNFNQRVEERSKRDPLGGDKLLRNDQGHFTDVSDQAGIYGSVIGFGLGITIGDVNKDGWMDIYVSNDFFERDYLYINNGDGTFKERLTESMKSISNSSMGADLADINNDAWPDFFVTEMLPGAHDRFKSVTTFQNWDTYQSKIQNGYHHQFTRNSLQLNNGDLSFSEIGRLADVEATDWSWGALIFDMDNDGFKDLFVANGIYKDLTDQDYLQYISHGEIVRSMISKKNLDYEELIDAMPSTPVSNHAFRNTGNLFFTDETQNWGLSEPSFSNGSAYGDLDNDGDQDLVVNNVNMKAFIYENRAEKFFPEHTYLKIKLEGKFQNTNALGAKILLEAGGKKFYAEQMPVRGYQSSVDPVLNVGLGKTDMIDKITVEWPYGDMTILENVPTNQTLRIKENEAHQIIGATLKDSANLEFKFQDVTESSGVNFRHIENDFVDFDREPLIFHMLSADGPRMCKGDVNGDGLEDFFVGGAKGQAGALFVQFPSGKFKRTNEKLFELDKAYEDTDCVLFDADGDKDLDLYVATGGNEFTEGAGELADRLYMNDGEGNFTRSYESLSALENRSTSSVKISDYDKDGDLDLFLGIRLKPCFYGMPVDGLILNNDGKGRFRGVTPEVAPGLLKTGLVTDAQWADVDGDSDDDLLVAGEWMPLKLFINNNGKLIENTSQAGLEMTHGWWNRLVKADIDNDGDIDFIAGNHGLNSRFKGTAQKPAYMYVKDFENNGSLEQIICVFSGEESYPMVLRHDLVGQIQRLKKKYVMYEAYKDQTVYDIFSEGEINDALQLKCSEFRTALIINDGRGKFKLSALPVEAQFSPVFAICPDDVNKDGNSDMLLAGNFYRAKPETGRYDASFGTLLIGDGKLHFDALKHTLTGWKIDGEVRDILKVNGATQKFFIVARNNDKLQVFLLKGE